MDLDTTLATIADAIPENISQAVSTASGYIPAELADSIRHAYYYFPAEIDLASAAMFMLYFAAASLILGVTGRVVLGKRSSLNHSLSSAMGILAIYAITVVVYTFRLWDLQRFLSPLPFVTFSGDYLILLPITDTTFPALCTEILSLVILAFLVNLIDTVMPKGKSVIGWYLLRFVSVALSMGLHYVTNWAFHTYLPDFLVTYAPAVLLFILIFLLFSGLVSLILGLIISIQSPFLGAMYTFFFTNIVGKQVSKAAFSAAILTAIFYLMGWAGYTIISITAASLLSFIPMAVLALVLWYLIGHLL